MQMLNMEYELLEPSASVFNMELCASTGKRRLNKW